MKKFLITVFALIGIVFLYTPWYFLWVWILNSFCSVFVQFNSCNIVSDPYNLSTFELIFHILWITILFLIFLFIFYKDNKKTIKKSENWKKIKSFRLM